jgi:nicotinamidase-related amidase
MNIMSRHNFSAAAAILLVVLALPAVRLLGPAHAQTIVDQWTSVQTPPAPALKAVTADAKTTALLMLDFMNQNCGKRPRCPASIPAMKKLLGEARAAKVMVVYSIIANTTTADIIKDVAPEADEPWVRSGPDKFLNTDLEKILKDRGIKTVIVTGTASNAAVLFTGAGAALRGMKVIVPIDGMSAGDAYADLATAYLFANASLVSANSSLTKIGMIHF